MSAVDFNCRLVWRKDSHTLENKTATGISCMFFRAWHQLHIFPRPTALECFPRPTALECFPRPTALECFPRPTALECFPRLLTRGYMCFFWGIFSWNTFVLVQYTE